MCVSGVVQQLLLFAIWNTIVIRLQSACIGRDHRYDGCIGLFMWPPVGRRVRDGATIHCCRRYCKTFNWRNMRSLSKINIDVSAVERVAP